VLRGLSANTVYNISVVAITGEDITGEHSSVIVMTTIGGVYQHAYVVHCGQYIF